jgi:hypothetical protein
MTSLALHRQPGQRALDDPAQTRNEGQRDEGQHVIVGAGRLYMNVMKPGPPHPGDVSGAGSG